MAALKTLGFKKTRVTGGRTGIYWDAELLDRLKERFGPPPVLQNASLPSLSSLHEETIPSQSEDSGDGEDISGAPSPPASSPVIAEISRLRILILQKVLPDLEARIGYGTIPQMVYSCQDELGVDFSAELVEGVVKSLEKEGVIFTPSPGCYRRTTSGPQRTETA